MRRTIVFAGAAMGLTMAVPAHAADCQSDLADLNERISRNEQNYRVVVGDGMAGDIRRLRDAARIFAENGRDDICRDVVAAVEDMLESRREALSGSERAIDGVTWVEREITRIKQARPVGELTANLRAAELIGADVRNTANEDLGEIEDVVLAPESGKIEYAIMSHGGFLGMGEEQVAVPWDAFMVTDDEAGRIFVLNMSEETLEEAPSFERGGWSDVDNERWRRENDRHFTETR